MTDFDIPFEKKLKIKFFGLLKCVLGIFILRKIALKCRKKKLIIQHTFFLR